MFGQHAFGSVGFGDSANTEPATTPAAAPSATVDFTTLRKTTQAILEGPSQSLQLFGGPSLSATLTAFEEGVGPPIFSEQIADAAATTTRNATVITAAIPLRLVEVGVDFDSTVSASDVDSAELVLKRFANGEAISSGLTNALSSASEGFAARTKYTFTWNGAFELEAGDSLVLAITKSGLGVALPKFAIIGTTRIL